jgi:hypothetical protein
MLGSVKERVSEKPKPLKIIPSQGFPVVPVAKDNGAKTLQKSTQLSTDDHFDQLPASYGEHHNTKIQNNENAGGERENDEDIGLDAYTENDNTLAMMSESEILAAQEEIRSLLSQRNIDFLLKSSSKVVDTRTNETVSNISVSHSELSEFVATQSLIDAPMPTTVEGLQARIEQGDAVEKEKLRWTMKHSLLASGRSSEQLSLNPLAPLNSSSDVTGDAHNDSPDRFDLSGRKVIVRERVLKQQIEYLTETFSCWSLIVDPTAVAQHFGDYLDKLVLVQFVYEHDYEASLSDGQPQNELFNHQFEPDRAGYCNNEIFEVSRHFFSCVVLQVLH